MKNDARTRFARSAIAAAFFGLLASAATAQSNVKLSLQGPASNSGPWGASFPVLAALSGDCSGPVSGTVFLKYLPGNDVLPIGFPGSIPCNAGRFDATSPVRLAWSRLQTDWHVFQASTTLMPGGAPAQSAFTSLRFDPEFVMPYGGQSVAASLATDAGPTYSSCDGHAFEVLDREAMNVPPPPANVRTPLEMFRVTASRCDSAAPQLLNMRLPGGYDQPWVYDRAGGIEGWRAPQDGCSTALCPPLTALFFGFERGANIPLFGDAAGVRAIVAFAIHQPDLRDADLQDLWWAGPPESGWGLNIAKSGEKLFVSGFIYDEKGRPMWVYMPQGQWDPITRVWYGDLYSPTGARYGAYSPTLFNAGAAIGTGSLSFIDADRGHFDYTVKGASGGKAISRYVFGARPGNKSGKYTGIWWGLVEQSGWGLAVSHQGDTVFATWYTYDDDFKATWFFMPEGKLTPSGSYAGALYRTTGAEWAGQHYQAASTKVMPVGTMDLRFGDATHVGTMTAVVNGQTIVNPLTRFEF